MALIKSISGIRGTIGGYPEENLTPIDIVKFCAAYGSMLLTTNNSEKITVIIGRDARISGMMVKQLVINTLIGMGINIIDLDLATTPTVEMAVKWANAKGGIILTASHNPKEWNAMKFLNHKGEFISDTLGKEILAKAEKENFEFAGVDDLGTIERKEFDIKHIEAILKHPLVQTTKIRKEKFKVVVDGINSVGGIVIPKLLQEFGVEVICVHCTPNGNFAHNPEPLKKHLADLSTKVIEHKADLGIAVDPDVDRLAFIDEHGEMFGEEYTLVACADYVLSKTKGNTVSNLSSTRALREITEAYGGKYFASAVGEVNVVKLMKEKNAVIGGEGNGGIIDPQLHYGRDALIGIGLFLSLIAERKQTVSELKKSLPAYYMSKDKIVLDKETNTALILKSIAEKYAKHKPSTIDGVKIDFENSWIHLRLSNTEPIIRIYAEAKSEKEAILLTEKIKEQILAL